MVISQRLCARGSTLLAGLEDHHFAGLILQLTFAVVRKHAFLECVRLGLDVLAPLILDYRKRGEPHLGIDTDQIR